MPRRPHDQTFTQIEIARALRGVKSSGVNARIEIDKLREKITIIPTDESPQNSGVAGNPWDEVLSHDEDPKRPS